MNHNVIIIIILALTVPNNLVTEMKELTTLIRSNSQG